MLHRQQFYRCEFIKNWKIREQDGGLRIQPGSVDVTGQDSHISGQESNPSPRYRSIILCDIYRLSFTWVQISPQPDQEGNKLQRPNSIFRKPLKKKKIRRLSVQPGLRGSNDLRVGRKMATFQLFFQSDRAKDLSAPLYSQNSPRLYSNNTSLSLRTSFLIRNVGQQCLRRDSSVSIVTRLQGSIPDKGKTLFYSPKAPNWSWGPPGLVFSVKRQVVKLITDI